MVATVGAAPCDYAAACAALAALIGTHYRPTGHDAATTFKQLGLWVQARAARRASAPSAPENRSADSRRRGRTCDVRWCL
jgi:hypothetical protein